MPGASLIIDRFLMSRRGELTAGEKEVLSRAIDVVVSHEGRRTLVSSGTDIDASVMLLEGFMSRHVHDRRGVRQLVAIHVPGDFVDLHGFPLRQLDHDVGTITPVLVAVFEHRALQAILDDHPTLAKKLWFSTLLDAAMHREWVFRLGRLKADARIAHLLAETNARLVAVGLSDGRNFDFPLTQFDVAEICGMTAIHVNRVLRQLRERDLCTLRNGRVEIHDLAGLTRLGEFEPGYLYLSGEIASRVMG